MKTIKRTLTFLFLSLFLALSAFAQSVKTIHLKDGSIIKGEVLELKNNVYTIKTPNLGQMQVADSDILTITSEEKNLLQPSNNPSESSGNLKQQVQQLQGTVMSDPKIMSDIEHLMEDPEIKSLLADPSFMKNIMSFDPAQIQNNDKVKMLMDNPKMKSVMEEINQKISTQNAPAQ